MLKPFTSMQFGWYIADAKIYSCVPTESLNFCKLKLIKCIIQLEVLTSVSRKNKRFINEINTMSKKGMASNLIL